MDGSRKVTFYHSPNTRSTGTLTLLEELGAPYELKVLNMKAGEQRRPAYLAVNPMGKVPAIDVLWGGGLFWTTSFKLVPELPEIMAYVKLVGSRPAAARAREKDAALAAAQEAAQ